MKDINQNYYEQNAQAFFDSTVNVEMSSLYNKFLKYVPPGSSILDAGCGAGRDSRAFLDLGYDVEAMDASQNLADLASKLIDKPVQVCFFQDFISDKKFDGIWACASLLHVPLLELPCAFTRLTNSLKQKGVFYCSFKLGDDLMSKNDRVFTNMNKKSVELLIENLPLEIIELWETEDLRSDRKGEPWLDVIMSKIK